MMAIGEVRVYDKNMNLKKVVSSKTLTDKLFAECGNLKSDVNLKPSKGLTNKKKKVRYLTCYGCQGQIRTTASMAKYYCSTWCGDSYRLKMRKSGRGKGNHKLIEKPWVKQKTKQEPRPGGRVPNTRKTARGEGRLT